MLLYRVFWHRPAARPGLNGHHNFLYKPQDGGRWDNPGLYDAWYLSRAAEGAVGEAFGDLKKWSSGMFRPAPGFRKALGVFQVDDGIPLLDLNNALALHERSLRPTDVVSRNRPATQHLAGRAFREADPSASRRWAGLSWWSLRWSDWNPVCLWVAEHEASPLVHLGTERLALEHPAVQDAAKTLAKKVVSARTA